MKLPAIFSLSRLKSAIGVTTVPDSALGNSFWGSIGESFSGAWQRNITVESQRNLLAFSAVYACVRMISKDIAKLRPRLVELKGGIFVEVERKSPFWRPLLRPNTYQSRIQFIFYWVTCRLLYGNVYILKERDGRGVVQGLHVLDPRLVTVQITPDGGVYYQLKRDHLSRGENPDIVMPASEIIHDRDICLWSPLIGVSPIFACGASATQGIRIQNNSAQFFSNMSRPSGHLTAPGEITDANASRMKAEFERNFAGSNIGRLLVTGDGISYEPLAMPANDSQLIEQLKWTVEDVARCFNVPLHKLSTGQNPTFSNVAALNQDYYAQTLQEIMESVELLLAEGLEVGNAAEYVYSVAFDLNGLFRMDPAARATTNKELVGAGIKTPDEARADEDMPHVDGGDVAYMQQQNYPLGLLSKRPPPDSKGMTPPTSTPVADPPTTPEPAADAVAAAKSFTDSLIAKFAQEADYVAAGA